MTPLAALQRAFQAYVLERDPAILEAVVSTPDANATRRLDIYAEGYRLRLLEALATDYPGVHGLLGDAQFERLGREYIENCRSRHSSLRWFGEGLSAFLAARAPWNAQPVVAELARFEWCKGEVFDAPDGEAVAMSTLERLAPAQWAQLSVRAHPSLRQLDLHWNVAPIWQALDAGETPPAPARAPHPRRWVMWRRGLDPHWRSLAVDEAWALERSLAGVAFAQVCEGLGEWLATDQIALQAAGFLKQWVGDEMLGGIRLPPASARP